MAYFKSWAFFILFGLEYCTAYDWSLDSVSPVITFERNSTAKWRNVTLPEKFSGFYSEMGEVLHASCSAPYPLVWDVEGFINPVSILRIREPERTFNPDKFTIRLAAFFNTAENEPFLASSVRIRCKNPENFLKHEEFSMYVKGNQNRTLLPKSDRIFDSRIIPCLTTTPDEIVTLFKLNGTEAVKVEDVKYDPWRGFGLDNFGLFEEGIYFCKQGSSEVKIITKRPLQHHSVTFQPTTEEKLRKFSDDDILLSCSSNLDEGIEFKFDEDSVGKLNITYTNNSTENKALFITPLDKEAKRVEGKVTCFREGVPVRDWIFEFIKAPEIFFDDYFSEMHCLTDFKKGDEVEVEAKSLRCSNDIGCNYYERCLEEGNVCDHLGKVVYSDKRRTQCAPLADRKVRDCVNLYYTSWNGVAQCKVNGLTRNWSYFTALDLHKYTDWKKVEENDLLRLEKEENKLNGFRCTGVGFLFANSLAFELKYANNSTELIQGEGDGGKVTKHEHPSPYKIQGFQVVSSLEIFKPESVKSVRCVGSFWNSTEVLRTPAYNL